MMCEFGQLLSGQAVEQDARRAPGSPTLAAFTAGLNEIRLVAAIIALLSGVAALASVRGQDFARRQYTGSLGVAMRTVDEEARTGKPVRRVS
jgi:hypothetical protein